MALSKPKSPMFDGEDRYTAAKKYLYRLLPDFPDYSDFTVIEQARKTGWQGDDLTGVFELQVIIQELLVEKYQFAEISPRSDARIFLTQLGRDEKHISHINVSLR